MTGINMTGTSTTKLAPSYEGSLKAFNCFFNSKAALRDWTATLGGIRYVDHALTSSAPYRLKSAVGKMSCETTGANSDLACTQGGNGAVLAVVAMGANKIKLKDLKTGLYCTVQGARKTLACSSSTWSLLKVTVYSKGFAIRDLGSGMYCRARGYGPILCDRSSLDFASSSTLFAFDPA